MLSLNLGEKKSGARQGNGIPDLEELVKVHQDRIYNLSYQLTGNHADAQDLAQEVFIRAYNGLAKFRQEAELSTWLHRITVNLFLNLKRKKSRQPTVSLDAPLETDEGEITREIAAAGGNPQEHVEELELQGIVQTALRQLPAEYQAVLVLREMQGYSYEEIAIQLNCPRGTVKSRLYRARKAMRKQMLQMEKTAPNKRA